MIRVNNLKKRFGSLLAVDGVSFCADSGEILGFLGPNGAGKTTILNMISGLFMPDEGDVVICGIELGKNPLAALNHIGYMPETPALYRGMSVLGFLKFVAAIKGVEKNKVRSRVVYAMEACGLDTVEKSAIRTLSKGFYQRVMLAAAIVHDPDVLLLDEPTAGLDPNQIVEIRSLIASLARDKTVIFSSHILSEAEKLCSRAVILHKGKMLALDTMDNLLSAFAGKQILRVCIEGQPASPAEIISAIPGVTRVEIIIGNDVNTALHIEGNKEEGIARAVHLEAVRQKWVILEITPVKHNLEEVFSGITSDLYEEH